MSELIRYLKNRIFDLAVIGGGINGAGIALDAALRGLSVVLLEKNDFGGFTTSASTKLIHGGLRYLEYFEFSLVRESLRERERLLRNAPHLVTPLKLNLPVYEHSSRGPLMIKTGMILYDWLSSDKSLPNHTFKFKNNHRMCIKRDGLKAIASYYDCQIAFPERLCLEIILSAREAGAMVFNHCEFLKLDREDNSGLRFVVRNGSNREICHLNAKIIVNAGGPFVDDICKRIDKKIDRKIGGTKGSHIIINRFENGPEEALYVEAVQDGRPFFIIPWRGYYLVGTTDLYYDGKLDRIAASEDEIEYLLRELNYLIPARVFTKKDILYSYSGIRPLPYEPGKKESRVTRKHIIYDHEKHDGRKNFISIIGGKLTTYRSLAEESVDLICKKLGKNEKTKTRDYPLFGGYGIVRFEKYLEKRTGYYSEVYGLSRDTIGYLIRFYGSKFTDVLALIGWDAALKEKICERNKDIKAQIVYSIRFESAKTLEDILLRRTGIGTSSCLGLDCVDTVAEIAGERFGWNKEEMEKKIVEYKRTIEKKYLYGLNSEIKKELQAVG